MLRVGLATSLFKSAKCLKDALHSERGQMKAWSFRQRFSIRSDMPAAGI